MDLYIMITTKRACPYAINLRLIAQHSLNQTLRRPLPSPDPTDFQPHALQQIAPLRLCPFACPSHSQHGPIKARDLPISALIIDHVLVYQNFRIPRSQRFFDLREYLA